MSLKIVQISDIHFSLNYNLNRLDKIKENICKINPDYVCIVGDLIDEYNSSNIGVFCSWLKDLSNCFKVIVVIGNHDYIEFFNGKYVEHSDISWLLDIQSDSLIVLDNDVYSDGVVNFIGVTLDFAYYYNHSKVDFNSYNRLISGLIDKVNSGYNILLVHTPTIIFENDNYKRIINFNKINMILCGHTHGGLVPSFFPGNFGFVSTNKKLFPKYVRGMIRVFDCFVFISSGIVKLSRKSGLSLFNDLFGYNINVININKKL